MSPSDTPKIPVRPIPTNTVTPTPVTFEIITANNFTSLIKISQTDVVFDIEFKQLYGLIPKLDTAWFIQPAGGTQITDLTTQKKIAYLDETGRPGLRIVSPYGHYLATVSPDVHEINLWDMESFQKVRTLFYPNSSYKELKGIFSKDNQYLAVGGCRLKLTDDEFCRSSTVLVYEINTSETILELDGYQTAVTGLAFSPDNRLLFMSGDGENIRNADLLVWDLGKSESYFESTLGEDDWFTDIALSDDGNTLVAISSHEDVHIWDVEAWNKIGELPIHGASITFLPGTDLFLAAKVDSILQLGRGNEIIATKQIGPGWVDRVFTSPDGRFLYILFDGGVIQKWGIAH